MSLWHDSSASRAAFGRQARAIVRRCTAMVACIALLLSAGHAAAVPSYFSYWGLGADIPEAQDHVNLYWAVSWSWDSNEVLSQLADAKARGMRAVVHTEFVFWNGSGQFANSCPYFPRQDAASRWDAFVQALSRQGLLDTVVAFYPVDEPDKCGVSSDNMMTALNIIRAHPLTSGKAVAVVFTCDIAEKYGGRYRLLGEEHKYGEALRAYDWGGVDCYGSENMFTEPAWSMFDFGCFCTRPGPSLYDNLKGQLNAGQRVILVPQAFISAESDGLPDDPQLFASRAAADPSVIAIAPFTWFDMPRYPGVRSQPALAQQWRTIGRSISSNNPPNANPPLPAPVVPRLQMGASDLQHLSAYDVDCNSSNAAVCKLQLYWQTASTADVQLFERQGTGAPQLLTCALSKGSMDIPWMSAGTNFTYDLYQLSTCTSAIPANAKPIASLNLSLMTAATGLPIMVIEFYNASLDHYFISWLPEEIAKLDAGTTIKGWTRTGRTFMTWTTAQGGSSPVCRFYIPPLLGDSHFFGRGTAECFATAQKNPSFTLEDAAFMQMILPVAGVCPSNTVEIYRVFDNRVDANHRYMTDKTVRDQMVAKGWIAEGDGPNMVTMCAPQPMS